MKMYYPIKTYRDCSKKTQRVNILLRQKKRTSEISKDPEPTDWSINTRNIRNKDVVVGKYSTNHVLAFSSKFR